MENPRLYATFLLWLLSELFEELPEVGDLDKPKLVFFFDEAHLLFNEAPKALLEKIEQVVRLIRSKGVGVYLVTQNPLDVPDKVLAQLGNRVQHALRAFTPRDQKAVRAAAETFRANPKLDTASVIMQLEKGEALVSFLEGNGTPSMVERCMIRPPAAQIGPISPEMRAKIIHESPVAGKYDTTIDNDSAYEQLLRRHAGPIGQHAPETQQPAGAPQSGGIGAFLGKIVAFFGAVFGTTRSSKERLTPTQYAAREVTRNVINKVAGGVAANLGRSVGGSVGGTIGRAIVRGTLGGMMRRR
jgi:hypothetical protein